MKIVLTNIYWSQKFAQHCKPKQVILSCAKNCVNLIAHLNRQEQIRVHYLMLEKLFNI